jgi:hypothetical protein
MTAEVGYRCARGTECPDHRPGFDHAHGAITGQSHQLAANHRPGCSAELVHRGGFATTLSSCECGAAVQRDVVP